MPGFTISKRDPMHVIGFWTECPTRDVLFELLRLRTELLEDRYTHLLAGAQPQNALERAIVDHGIGAFGVLLGIPGDPDRVCLMLAGRFTGGTAPEPLRLARIPEGLWAGFSAEGEALPTLRSLCTRALHGDLDGKFERTGLCSLICFPADPANSEYRMFTHVRRARKAAPDCAEKPASSLRRGYF